VAEAVLKIELDKKYVSGDFFVRWWTYRTWIPWTLNSVIERALVLGGIMNENLGNANGPLRPICKWENSL